MERGGNSDGDIAEASKPASDGDVVPTVGDIVPEVLVPESHFTGKDANVSLQLSSCHKLRFKTKTWYMTYTC